jgi:hypothetical protein
MMYLPYKAAQEADARKLMVDMFELVMPEKMSEAVVQKDVKLIYDPSTHELIQVVMPFETRSEVSTLTLDKGWVTSASVEDVKPFAGRAPHDVSNGRRQVGRTRSRQRHQVRKRSVSVEYRRPGLVGKSG